MHKKYIFKKTHEVDKERFAELLLAAKGNMTMKDFAILCNANPSTFTRIVKQDNKGASSPELLEAIAQNASPNSNVTLEALAQANGYTLEENNPLSAKIVVNDRRLMEDIVQSTVANELLERGKQVRLGGIKYNVSKRMLLSPDALILTDAFNEDDNNHEDQLWFVDAMLTFKERYPGQGAYASNIRHKAFNTLSRFAFISMAASDFLKPQRYSLVVTDPEAFEIIVEEFSETIFTADTTLILIDSFNRRIIKEHMFPLKGCEKRESFFMTIKPLTEDMIYFDKNADYETEDDE